MNHRLVLAMLIAMAALIAGVFLVPERVAMPVKGATVRDWNPRSFWYSPWGPSGVHKGIDIFAREGASVRSSSDGIVLFTGTLPAGGNVIGVLGPKWRLHYYAHLKRPSPLRRWTLVAAGSPLGEVGTSGNARGRPPHLHYAMVSLVPLPWAMRPAQPYGWARMYFLDPGARLQRLR